MINTNVTVEVKGFQLVCDACHRKSEKLVEGKGFPTGWKPIALVKEGKVLGTLHICADCDPMVTETVVGNALYFYIENS